MEIRELTKAELEIMYIIWGGGVGLFLADIIKRIPEPKPAYTTVSTVIRVLVRKGFVTYEEFSKSNRYKAAVDKDEYSRFALDRMKRVLFDGSAEGMISFLANNSDIPAESRDKIIESLK